MMTEHWLSIAAGVFLVGMMLYGHYRGLLRQCVSLGALVLTIITVKVATPYVTDFVKANPVIRENAAHFIMEVSGWQPPEESESIVLLENNNSEFYRLLGVDQFGEYISTCLSDMLINTLGSVLVFAASYIVIHLVIRWLNLLSRLPIICGLNQMAGGIVGLAEGFLLLWLFYGDSNGADAGSAGKQQYLAFTDLQI